MSRFPRVTAVTLTAFLLVPAGLVTAQDASPQPLVPESEPGSLVHDVSGDGATPGYLAAALAALLLVPTVLVTTQDAAPTSVMLESEPGSLVHDVSGDGSMPEYLAADPSITDPSATPWERLEIGSDGLSLRVFFSTGAAGCYGLARIEIDRSLDTPVVTLWTGLRSDAAARICDAMNYDYYTDVGLDAPVVRDGSSLEGMTIAPVAMGPGIGVADVDDAPTAEVLLVNGSLLVGPDGEVRLWESLAESDPPQGAGRSLLVTGLDESRIDWAEAGGVKWSENVQLLGRVVDDALVIDTLVR